MQFKIIPELNNNQYSIMIKFDKYGNEKLTEEQEKELINDYVPCIEYKNITFIGDYYYDEKENKIKKYEPKKQEILVNDRTDTKKSEVKDESIQTEENKKEIESPEVTKLTAKIIPKTVKESINKISLVVNNKTILINDTLELQYIVNSSQILDSELGGSLDTKDKIAKAKCYLFADKVVEAIKNKLEEIRKDNSKFEEETIVVL